MPITGPRLKHQQVARHRRLVVSDFSPHIDQHAYTYYGVKKMNTRQHEIIHKEIVRQNIDSRADLVRIFKQLYDYKAHAAHYRGNRESETVISLALPRKLQGCGNAPGTRQQ